MNIEDIKVVETIKLGKRATRPIEGGLPTAGPSFLIHPMCPKAARHE